jgi:hypothetical protein
VTTTAAGSTASARRVRLNEIVYSLQETPVSAGLFVSFADAFRVVKEFMETDGELPTCIEWGPGVDFPDEAFLPPNRRSI